jgi:hypothetical protein
VPDFGLSALLVEPDEQRSWLDRATQAGDAIPAPKPGPADADAAASAVSAQPVERDSGSGSGEPSDGLPDGSGRDEAPAHEAAPVGYPDPQPVIEAQARRSATGTSMPEEGS